MYIVKNRKFNNEIGIRLLKLEHKECPYEEIKEDWEKAKPLTFKEIAAMENVEDRRVAFLVFGLERLEKKVKPVLLSRETVKKTTSYIDQNGNHITRKYDDTYDLYMVKGSNLGKDMKDCYFVKFKDTSTDREYMLWVDIRSILRQKFGWGNLGNINQINAIDAIAWTIMTNIPEGQIKEIIRQGDCILVAPIEGYDCCQERHLTAEEYLTLITAES